MRTLLVDNYDSFTYNLYQLLSLVYGEPPQVVRNDDHALFDGLDPASFVSVVISPGPGRPERDADFGVSRRALEWSQTPLLGVCLGHQGLCHFAGAKIELAPPMHGRTSRVRHDGSALFAGIPSPFSAVRYHSLVATELPAELQPCAHTEDGWVMAVRHTRRPRWGVQFHPESIAAEHGRTLLENFRDLSVAHRDGGREVERGRDVGRSDDVERDRGVERDHDVRRSRDVERDRGVERVGAATARRTNALRPAYRVHVVRDVTVTDTEAAFARLDTGGPIAWLDTSARQDTIGRFSILALPSADQGEVVSYRVGGPVEVTRLRDGAVSRVRSTLFDYLERELERRAVEPLPRPSGFALGYVGALGYELKADAGAKQVHRSPLPDAVLLFCDRALVVDHETGRGTLLALATDEDPEPARRWLERTRRELEALEPAPPRAPAPCEGQPLQVDAHWRHSDAAYERLIAECLDAITNGESYELCLTNRITVPFAGDPVSTYLELRRESPAPYSAFLRCPGFCVLSASPERFLWLDADGHVESRPIKGTAPRSADPTQDERLRVALATSEKERAENLMIVDLVRNDLGRVCEVGSVHVPRLFGVDSYRSVHQLVSTVAGRLRPGTSPVELVRACFPGGSMTGAPKLRTMEILDRLEGEARGIYSGALGYFSLSGALDLSIVIRTMVLFDGRAQIGVGGAIVALSEPKTEVKETHLKAQALLETLGRVACREGPVGVPPALVPEREP